MSNVVPVTIYVDVENIDGTRSKLASIGLEAENTTKRIVRGAEPATISTKMMALQTASLMTNMMQLTDVIDRMNKGQIDAGRGMVILGVNALQLGSNIMLLSRAINMKTLTTIADTVVSWGAVAADKARGIASAIATGLSQPWMIPVIATAAAGAAGIAVAAMGAVPSRQEGGKIYQTGLYMLHAGETVSRSNSIVINVNGSGAPSETAREIVREIRAAGII